MQEKDDSGRFLYSEGLVDRILSNMIDKLRSLSKQKPDPFNSKEKRLNLIAISNSLQTSCNELSGGIKTLGDLIDYLYDNEA